MARIGRKTMRRGEAFVEKSSMSGLVAKNPSRHKQARAKLRAESGRPRESTANHRSSMRHSRAIVELFLRFRQSINRTVNSSGWFHFAILYSRKEHVNNSVGGAFKLGIAHALRDPSDGDDRGHLSGQRIVQEDCQPFDWNRCIAQLSPMTLEHSSDERSGSCWSVGVPGFADLRAVRFFSNGKPMEIHRAFRTDELEDVKGERFSDSVRGRARIVDLRQPLIRFSAKRLDAADE